MTNSKFYNPTEICEQLHISKPTLWRYVKNGKLPQPTRLSRAVLLWEKSAIDDFLGLDKEKGE